jgi:hypothetical protein
MMEEYLRTGHGPQAPKTLIEDDYLLKMGNEVVRQCDVFEKYGLVDYQMGVAEEEIIASKYVLKTATSTSNRFQCSLHVETFGKRHIRHLHDRAPRSEHLLRLLLGTSGTSTFASTYLPLSEAYSAHPLLTTDFQTQSRVAFIFGFLSLGCYAVVKMLY